MLTTIGVEGFIVSRKAKNLSPDTIRWYEGILNQFAVIYIEVPKSAQDLERFIADCTAGDERRHGYFRALRAFYRWLDKRQLIKRNPMAIVDPPRRAKKTPPTLPPSQIYQLLNYPHPLPIKAALLFLVDTGCRVGELSNLKPADLLETPGGYIARVRGKTGQRLVPISREVYSCLVNILPLPYSRYWLRRLISKAFRNAAVPGTAHTLRHTFGTLWSGDELVLQDIMGHANLATTRIYRHLRTDRLSEQHHKYTPLAMVAGFPTKMNL